MNQQLSSQADAAKVPIVVSDAMVQLRSMQRVLNGFWQTSELAFGYMLSHAPTLAEAPDRPTVDVLGHLESQVWFPNNQGRIKRNATIGETMDQVRENTVHAYRATLLSFYSMFEGYLNSRVTTSLRRGDSWGPFVRSLSIPALMETDCALPLHVVLCADFSRQIRNKLIHEKLSVPASMLDAEVVKWKRTLHEQAMGHWPSGDIPGAVNFAVHKVVGMAAEGVQKAKNGGKNLPPEYFYMLFNFTNLDNLAFAIEEALQPRNAKSDQVIYRSKSDIRRPDLIVSQPAS